MLTESSEVTPSIVRSIQELLGVTLHENVDNQFAFIQSHHCLSKFVQDADCMQLCVRFNTGGDVKDYAEVSNSISSVLKTGAQEVYMLKTGRTNQLSKDYMRHMISLSTMGNAMSSFYDVVHNIFAPRILKENLKVDAGLTQTLAEMEQSLTRAMANTGKEGNEGIFSLKEEVAYYQNVLCTRNSAVKSSAEQYVDCLKVVSEKFANMDEITQQVNQASFQADLHTDLPVDPRLTAMLYSDVVVQDMLQNLTASMLKLWKCNYPVLNSGEVVEGFTFTNRESAFKRLFLMAFASVEAHLKAKLRCIQHWYKMSESNVRQTVYSCLQCITECHTSLQAFCDRTSASASNASAHATLSALFQHHTLSILQNRANQVLDLRMLITGLTSVSSNVLNNFQLFSQIDICCIDTSNSWDVAVKSLDSSLGSVEVAIATKIGDKQQEVQSQPAALLSICTSKLVLLKRKNIKLALSSRVDGVFTALSSYIDGRNSELGTKQAVGVEFITWCVHFGSKLQAVMDVVKILHTNSEACKACTTKTKALLEKTNNQQEQALSKWCKDVSAMLASSKNPLVKSNTVCRLMALDATSGGALRVFFDEDLVTVLKEWKVLVDLNLASRVPGALKALVNTSQTAYKYSLRIHQAANFYNAFHHELNSSQLGLLLLDAQAFESKIRDNASVDWGNSESAGQYLDELSAFMRRQEVHNGALQSVHGGILTQAKKLITLDLASELHTAEDILSKIKGTLEAVAQLVAPALGSKPVYVEEALVVWRRHCCIQTLKCITVAYQCLLQQAMARVEPVHCTLRLDFSKLKAQEAGKPPVAQEALSFDPPQQQLESSLLSNVKRLVISPCTLTSVCSLQALKINFPSALLRSKNLFDVLPILYSSEIQTLYSKVGQLTSDLTLFGKRYQKWVSYVWMSEEDLTLFASQLSDALQWDKTFLSLTSLYRQASAMETQVTMGCFTVSLDKLRKQICSKFEGYYTTLVMLLKAQALEHAKELDGYLTASLIFLTVFPSSLDAMGAARKRWQEMCHEKHSYNVLLDKTEEYERIVSDKLHTKLYETRQDRRTKTSTSGSLYDTGALRAKWDEFETTLSNYNAMLDSERDVLKAHVEEDVRKVEIEILKFQSRWKALKPQVPTDKSKLSPQFLQGAVASLTGWKEEHVQLTARANKTKDLAAAFEIPPPTESLVLLSDLLTKEIEPTMEQWSIMEDYQVDVRKLTLQKWVEVRPVLNSFEDVLKSWQRKLRQKQGAIGDLIQDEVTAQLQVFPVLKKVTGDSFTNDHWRAQFHKLGMVTATVPEFPETTEDRIKYRDVIFTSEPVSVANVTMHDFLLVSKQLQTHAKWIADLLARAQGEALIREAVDELKAWSNTAVFHTQTHVCTVPSAAVKNALYSKQVVLIKDWKVVFNDLSDKLSLLGSFKDSPYYLAYEDVCIQFESRLHLLHSALTQLQQIQRQWLYLEPIFQRGSLSESYSLFSSIHSDFCAISKFVEADSNIFALSQYPGLEQVVQNMAQLLERCHKILTIFLEERRDAFARFYFLSDEDLLEILGQTDNMQVINTHVKKLFSGVYSLVFHDDACYSKLQASTEKSIYVVGFRSKLGEYVVLPSPVLVTHKIEQWLQVFTLSMQESLHHSLSLALDMHKDVYTTSKNCTPSTLSALCKCSLNILGFSAQILQLAHSILYSNLMEDSMRTNSMASTTKKLQAMLNELTAINVRSVAESIVQGIAKTDLFANTNELTVMLRSFVGVDVTDIERILDNRIKTLVLDLIHYLDVSESLRSISSVDSWMWQKELRAYLTSADGVGSLSSAPSEMKESSLIGLQAKQQNTGVSSFTSSAAALGVAVLPVRPISSAKAVFRMGNTQFDYTYEYQGNEGKLVYTELTEKCYTVLTQAMHLGYGGSPYGPAGTGKTESVKALGQQLGRQVLVFNCDEGLDFQSMSRIFIGLLKTGAWGCFDEFNRLKQEQLSTISQQIQIIQNGLKRNLPTISLSGHTVPVSRNSGIFITMNPASKAYGGRSQLPHNLKELFRAVAMSIPDISLIAKVILQGEGFANSAVLGPRLVQLYTLCKDGLSSQIHYDWGLRSLKIILQHAGSVLRTVSKGTALTFEEEAAIIVSVLNSNTLSKLTYADSVKFNSIVKVVYPNIEPHTQVHTKLLEAVKLVLERRNLAIIQGQFDKIVQLYESLSQRMGVVLVGPAGSGKSVLLSVLFESMQEIGYDMRQYSMNPKAVDRNLLLGSMDNDTHQWSDGILTNASRSAMGLAGEDVLVDRSKAHNWILCDGDVDPEWIEALNSVLDDNKLQTMPNGTRIKFDHTVNFVFETHSLQFASPATISRMNIIFVNDQDLTMADLVSSWVSMQFADYIPIMEQFVPSVLVCLEYFIQVVQQNANSLVLPNTILGLVQTALSCVHGVQGKQRFALLLARGLCANLTPEYASKVFTHTMSQFGVHPPSRPVSYLSGKVNGKSTWALEMYQGMKHSTVCGGNDAEWITHALTAPITSEKQFALHSNDQDHEAPVQTDDYVSTPSSLVVEEMLRLWMDESVVSAMKPVIKQKLVVKNTSVHWPAVLLTGPSASGKLSLLSKILKTQHDVTSTLICCTPSTTAQDILSKLMELCAISADAKGKVLRPKDNKSRAVVIIKYINIIRADKYNTVQALALIQQLITSKGFYDAETLSWVRFEQVQIVCTANEDGPNRLSLSSRLVANMRVVYHPAPSDEEMCAIAHAKLASLYSYSNEWLFEDIENSRHCNATPVLLDEYRQEYPIVANLSDKPRNVLFASGRSKDTVSALTTVYEQEPTAVKWTDLEVQQKLAYTLVSVRKALNDAFHADINSFAHLNFSLVDVLRIIDALGQVSVTNKTVAHAVYELVHTFYISRLNNQLALHPIYGYTGTTGTCAYSTAQDITRSTLQTHLGVTVKKYNTTAMYTSLFQSLDLLPDFATRSSHVVFPGADTSLALDHVSRRSAVMNNNDYCDIFENALDTYSRDIEPVKVVASAELVHMFNRYEQILSKRSGHILIAGQANILKRLLLYIAGHSLKYTLYTPSISVKSGSSIQDSQEQDAKRFILEVRDFIKTSITSKSGLLVLLDNASLNNIHIMSILNALMTGSNVFSLLYNVKELEAFYGSIRAVYQNDSKYASLQDFITAMLAQYVRVGFVLNNATDSIDQVYSSPGIMRHCTVVHWEEPSPQTYFMTGLHVLQPVLKHLTNELMGQSQGFLKKNGVKSAEELAGPAKQQYANITKRDGYFLINQLYTVHLSRRNRGFGSNISAFTAMLQLYSGLFLSKKDSYTTKRDQLFQGVLKLREAASSVGELQKQSQAQQILVSAKQKEADEALQSITQHMSTVVERQSEVSKLSAHQQQEEGKIQERRSVVEKELAAIMPMVEEARKNVGNIKKQHLQEIKAYMNPLPAIVHVLGAVLGLLGVEDTSWTNMRKTATDTGFLDKVLHFDATNMDKNIRKKVNAQVKQNRDSFQQSTIAKVSAAAAPQADWVLAQLEFGTIMEQIEPKQLELSKADRELNSAREQMAAYRKELSLVEVQVADCKRNFGETTSEAERLKIGLAKITGTLQHAESLLGKLAGEMERWDRQVREYNAMRMSLPFECVIAAGLCTYLGSEDETTRDQFVDLWRSLCSLKSVDMKAILSSNEQYVHWSSTISEDTFALVNCSILYNTYLYTRTTGETGTAAFGRACFVVDPNNVIGAWVKIGLDAEDDVTNNNTNNTNNNNTKDKNKSKKTEAVVCSLHSDRLVSTVELAVRFGKTLVLTDVDVVPPLLHSLITCQAAYQSGSSRLTVRIGDKTVDLHAGFKLILISPENLHTATQAIPLPATLKPDDAADLVTLPGSVMAVTRLSPEIAGALTCVNYTVSEAGLQEKVLSATVSALKPELEAELRGVQKEQDQCRVELQQFELQLLTLLNESTTNLLDNQPLVENLDRVKSQSQSIALTLANGDALRATIESQRSDYGDVAATASRMFLALSQMSIINCMYQHSLGSFLTMYTSTLQDCAAQQFSTAKDAVLWLLQALTKRCYALIATTIFDRDRTAVGLTVLRYVFPSLASAKEWRVLSSGAAGTTAPVNVTPSWVPVDRIAATKDLLSAQPEYMQTLQLDQAQMWTSWINNPAPEENFPVKTDTPVTMLLLLQAVLPHRLPIAIDRIVCEKLQLPSLVIPRPSLRDVVPGLSIQPVQPLLYVCAAGADVTADIVAYASSKSCELTQIALGSGQTEAVLGILTKAAVTGEWILLKNLHLVGSWLSTLDKHIQAVTNTHANFRLFLTTEESSNIPTPLITRSRVIAYEQAPGIRNTILRSLQQWVGIDSSSNTDYFSKGCVARAQLLFLLTVFHAVVTERKFFCPQGWRKVYEFSITDLNSTADTIDQLFSNTTKVKAELVEQLASNQAAGISMTDLCLKHQQPVQPRDLQWDTLHGLIRNCFYGGRMDDNCDVQIQNILLSRYFAADALNVENNRGKRIISGIDLPNSTNIQDYIQLVDKIPQASETFVHLAQNAGREAEKARAVFATDTLRRVNAGAEEDTSAGVRVALAQFQAGMATIQQLAPTLPSITRQASQWGSIESYVALEASSLYLVLTRVQRSFEKISFVLSGDAAVTADVESEMTCLARGETPQSWLRDAPWGAEEYPQFCKDLVTKSIFATKTILYLNQQTSKSSSQAAKQWLGEPLILSHLGKPVALLNALQQACSEELAQPIDQVKLVVSLDNTLLPANATKLAMKQVYLTGADLMPVPSNNNMLAVVESTADSPNYNILPTLYLTFINKTAPNIYPRDKLQAIEVPVYTTHARDIYITNMTLPCTAETSKIALHGAAIVANIH